MRKRIACFHDLSSYGGAALMNIIPIMYSAGIEVCPIPTALFTSHGALEGSRCMEVSGFLKEYINQYQELKLNFQGIYLGLFKTFEQMMEAEKFLEIFSKEETLTLLDPIMGDNGKLYSFIKEENIMIMRELMKKVQIITPNFTEACILSGKEYKENISDSEMQQLLISLSKLGAKQVVVTSVPRGEILVSYIYDGNNTTVVKSEKRPGSYPGTGDAFTAILMEEILKGSNLLQSVTKASAFVERGIDLIISKGYNPLEGIPMAELLGTFRDGS